MARLHVICGNCGAIATSGLLKHKIEEGDEDCPARVAIHCENCSTVHDLDDTVPASQ